MRRLTVLGLILVLVLTMAVPSFAATSSSPITVILNGKLVDLDTPPQIINQRVNVDKQQYSLYK